MAPESPRWLISKGKEAEGLRILAHYHADGNDQDPLVQFEFEEIKAAIAYDRESKSSVYASCMPPDSMNDVWAFSEQGRRLAHSREDFRESATALDRNRYRVVLPVVW